MCKKIVLSVVVVLGCLHASAQKKLSPSAQSYDKELAQKLGADEYGMRSYVFCVLKTGKAKIKDEAKRKEVFRGHFENIKNLAKQGKLVLAGPFSEAEPWRGMYVFNVTKLSDAETLVKSDPAVAAGIFEYELKKIYATAALMKINEIHSKIQRKKIE